MELYPRFLLGIREHTPGVKDGGGNPIDAWGGSKDWPVYGYASGTNAEPGEINRDLSNVLWTVYAPVNAKLPSDKDLVILQGDEYAVEGVPQDFSHDPFGTDVGEAVVYLKRQDG